MKATKITRIIAALLLICIFVCCGSVSVFAADAPDKEYTDVITDLCSDSSFKVSDYPINNADYSLEVIQIAESVDGELFVYVYQPSALSKLLPATSINISTALGENLDPDNYTLTLISKDGLFAKYKVDDFAVKSDALRYYSISAIYRAFDASIDEAPDDDNTISEVSFAVGQLWTASTVNNKVSYSMIEQDVIIITDKHVGFIDYANTVFIFDSRTSSHYVAFATDHLIEDLIEAEIQFNTQQETVIKNTNFLFQSQDGVTKGEVVPHEGVKLSKDEILKRNSTGFFSEAYEYERIQSIDAFLENEGGQLTDETKTALSNMEWVLRFYETTYTSSMFSTTDASSAIQNVQTVTTYTRVSDVFLLRLKFETDGVVYNLGVVDNKTTGDLMPDNEYTPLGGNNDDIWEAIRKIISLVMIVILLAICLPLIAPLISVITGLLVTAVKLLVSIIMLPFKLFGGGNSKRR